MKRIPSFALAFAAALLVAAPALAETRIALVIGNGNYDARLGRLANPVNDANAVAAALRRAGFDVDVETDLDQKAMKRAILKLGERLRAAGPDATGLFYYGGHGLQVQGENYLVPVGADIEAEADADVEAVPAKGVLAQMEQAANAVNIVILDACRNTPVLRKFRGTDRGLARMDAPAGSFIAYSTAPGEVADDGTGGNSPFAAALVSQLGLPGEPIDDLFINIRRQVLADTHNRQTPWDSSSLVSKFFFLPGKPTSNPQPAPVDPQAVELAFWNGVANSTDAGVIQSYLDRYPNGSFVDAARAKLAALRKPSQVASIAPTQAPAITQLASDREGALAAMHDLEGIMRAKPSVPVFAVSALAYAYDKLGDSARAQALAQWLIDTAHKYTDAQPRTQYLSDAAEILRRAGSIALAQATAKEAAQSWLQWKPSSNIDSYPAGSLRGLNRTLAALQDDQTFATLTQEAFARGRAMLAGQSGGDAIMSSFPKMYFTFPLAGAVDGERVDLALPLIKAMPAAERLDVIVALLPLIGKSHLPMGCDDLAKLAASDIDHILPKAKSAEHGNQDRRSTLARLYGAAGQCEGVMSLDSVKDELDAEGGKLFQNADDEVDDAFFARALVLAFAQGGDDDGAEALIAKFKDKSLNFGGPVFDDVSMIAAYAALQKPAEATALAGRLTDQALEDGFSGAFKGEQVIEALKSAKLFDAAAAVAVRLLPALRDPKGDGGMRNGGAAAAARALAHVGRFADAQAIAALISDPNARSNAYVNVSYDASMARDTQTPAKLAQLVSDADLNHYDILINDALGRAGLLEAEN